MNSAVIIGVALGMRHGTDPDHLAVIDGLTRIRPRSTNGVFFALGHGLVVILLAVGTGRLLAGRFAFLGPWSLILIGAVNLWRLLRNSKQLPAHKHLVIAQPFLLGMLLAAGFETASQLSALILAGQNNAFLVGVAFSSGMVLVDGLDGYLAASTQLLAAFGEARAKAASRVLGVIVVIFAFSLGGAELFGMELARIALPLGLSLFIVVLAIRIWARSNRQAAEPEVTHTEPSPLTPRGNPAALTKE
jgi:nickel/cobalt transporter (NiCoT) family protein